MVDLVMKLGVPGLNKSDVTRDVRDVFDFEVEIAKVRGFCPMILLVLSGIHSIFLYRILHTPTTPTRFNDSLSPSDDTRLEERDLHS